MKITLFSVEQANRTIREIQPELEELVRARGQFRALERRLEVLPLALTGATPSNPDSRESRDLLNERSELAAKVRDGIRALHERGLVVRDLERGLVDFYSLAGDRLIFLCWQLGEKEVAHWHTLEGGFAARQPLDRSERE